jgi:hypothetical protein
MRIQGELYQILEYKDGEGKKGKWMKQSFVVKTFDQFPKHLAITCWGQDVEFIQSLTIYDRIELDIEVSSREYQSRWYNDITGSNFEILERHNGEPPLAAKARENVVHEDPTPAKEIELFPPDQELPF